MFISYTLSNLEKTVTYLRISMAGVAKKYTYLLPLMYSCVQEGTDAASKQCGFLLTDKDETPYA